MPVPRVYLTAGDAIATFDFVDIASGRGVVVFDCGLVQSGAYTLVTDTFFSENVTTSTTSTTGVKTKQLDIDFDTVLNLPRTVDGKILVNATMGLKNGNVGPSVISGSVVLRLRKFDGTTETELADDESDEFGESLAADASTDKTVAFEVDVDNKRIKQGETLRVTIEMNGWGGGGTARTYTLGHDPQDRNDPDSIIADASPKTLKIQIPFKLDT